MALISGSVTEVYVDGPRLRRRQLGAGGLSSRPEHIHDVVGTSRKPALSIHVYSPCLEIHDLLRLRLPGGLIPVWVEHDVHGAEVGDISGRRERQ